MELEDAVMQFNQDSKNRKYIYEKNIVFGTIVDKYKNRKTAVGIRNTIGYLLPNNIVYDFLEKKLFILYNENNLEQEGKVFFIGEKLFQESKRKIKLKSFDKEIKPIINYHMERYRKIIEYQNKFNVDDLINQEVIPENMKTKKLYY